MAVEATSAPAPAAQASWVVLVRFGEVALKGDNRRFFEQALSRQLARAVSPAGPFSLRNLYGRLVLVPEGPSADVHEAARLAARVFGVVGAVPAVQADLSEAAILQAAREVVDAHLRGSPPPAGAPLPFKVAARRSNRRFELDSMELNRRVGAHLLRTFGPRLKVDVHQPSLVVHVEVREREAFVYDGEFPGPGGLPVGVSGRALALLSGGIDSPVAAWMAMKRGLRVDAVHFHAIPFTSEQARLKVVRLAEALAPWEGGMRLHLVRFTEVQKAIYAHCPRELGVILMRRFMVRIADAIADREGYEALVTGENLGQVASQTVASMAAVQEVARRLILRPLLGWDKEEIVRHARRIGTYDLSVLPYEDCCTLFVARHPATRPRPDRVALAESRLDITALVEQALQSTEVVHPGEPPHPSRSP